MDLTEQREILEAPSPVLDVHVHPLKHFGPYKVGTVKEDVERLRASVFRSGVRKMWLFSVYPASNRSPGTELCWEANEWVRAMRDESPDCFIPFCYVNPADVNGAIEEMERCVVEHGFAGIKLWVAVRASDERLDPILDRAAALGIPVLQHAWSKTTGNLAGESFPEDVAELARRHPQVRIIMAHLNGCGLRGLEAVRDCPNVLVDTSGGDPESGMVEVAVARLGSGRVVYGSDAPIRHFRTQMGKTLGARISREVKQRILWDNAAQVLPRRAVINVAGGAGMIIDVNAYFGRWPTHPVPGDINEVVASLQEIGVAMVYLSPLDAAWYVNPHLANQGLYDAANRCDIVLPVPIIDPTVSTWSEELEHAARNNVRMVKLLPSYGRYELGEAKALLAELEALDMVVSVQTRMDDPRRHHPLAQVPDLPAEAVIQVARERPDMRIIIGGARTSEIRSLGPEIRELPHLFADVSQADGLDAVRIMVEEGQGNSLLFGSHAPIFIPWSALARVITDIDGDNARKILYENAREMGLGNAVQDHC